MIKRELDTLTASIERSKSRRRALESRVTMSTLTLRLSLPPPPAVAPSPPPPPPRGWSPLDAPTRAFWIVLDAAAKLLDFTTYSLVLLMPLALCLVLPALAVSRMRLAPSMASRAARWPSSVASRVISAFNDLEEAAVASGTHSAPSGVAAHVGATAVGVGVVPSAPPLDSHDAHSE